MKPRPPLLVIVWTFGLFILGNMVLYPHFFVASRWLGVSFGAIASGVTATAETEFTRGICGLVLGFPLAWVLVRFLWRRDEAWIGLRISGSALGIGFGAGLACAVLVVSTLVVMGVGRIDAGPDRMPAREIALALTGIVAWTAYKTFLEELVFRGMVTRELALRWNWPVATIVGGAVFAAMHIPALGPAIGFGSVSALMAGGIIVNVLLVGLYRRGGSLALPWGFHAGWNLALSGLVGTVMSGDEQTFGLFRVEFEGPVLLTGGAFGIELSCAALALMLVVGLGVWRSRSFQI